MQNTTKKYSIEYVISAITSYLGLTEKSKKETKSKKKKREVIWYTWN